MADDQETVHPWQIFCGLFVCFWVTSAYFDHFLMTLIFCIVFGVVTEIVTKSMYGGKSSNQPDAQKTNISSKAPEEIPELTVEEKMANNEKIWQKSGTALDKEDDVPPPLPEKDYETGKMDTLAEKLQALVDASAREEANKTPENDRDDKDVSDCVPVVAREYNRTVSDEYNQNTSVANSNLIQDITNRDSIIEEEAVGQRNSVDEDDQEISDILDDKKFYAPDSSDDEEDDDDFASREVNFDDSDSEDEDFDKYISNTNQDRTPENLETAKTVDTKEVTVQEAKGIDDDNQSEKDKNSKNSMNATK